MAKKKRDYKAEYARRIASGKKRGLTKSQARGHARPGERAIRPKTIQSDVLLEAALRNLRSLGKQNAAAKKAGVSVERFRRFLYDNKLAKRTGRKWTITDYRKREMVSYSDGRAIWLTLSNADEASANGHYLVAVGRFLRSNHISYIQPFAGKFVRDARGKKHLFETDPSELYRLTNTEEPFEQIYRFQS